MIFLAFTINWDRTTVLLLLYLRECCYILYTYKYTAKYGYTHECIVIQCYILSTFFRDPNILKNILLPKMQLLQSFAKKIMTTFKSSAHTIHCSKVIFLIQNGELPRGPVRWNLVRSFECQQNIFFSICGTMVFATSRFGNSEILLSIL